jgi:hypothetical protein
MRHTISRRSFVSAGTIAFAASAVSPGSLFSAEKEGAPAMLDHILLGCSDLDLGIAFVEKHTGVRAAFGGVHPGRGTRNALLSLGEKHYLEIIAPDPQQTGAPDHYGLQKLTEPRLVTWAVHTDDIVSTAHRAVAAGFAIDGPNDGSRARPDGVLLRWKSFSLKNMEGSPLPFFIEWDRATVHPSADAPSGCTLLRFAVQTTHRIGLLESFRRLGVEVRVEHAQREQLFAQVSGPKSSLMQITS